MLLNLQPRIPTLAVRLPLYTAMIQMQMLIDASVFDGAAERAGIQLPRAPGNAFQNRTISRAKRSAAMPGWAGHRWRRSSSTDTA